METKKNDFVEIEFTGYAGGQVFDSNNVEELKKINPEAKPRKTVVSIGNEMVVKGLDSALEGKEIGKDYEVEVGFKEGFGPRKRELMKTIPLKAFTDKKVQPYPGMVLDLDNAIAKIITVSGARVITDFNNPLAGKDLKYKFKIIRKVDDVNEKVTAVFEMILKFVPEFSVGTNEVTVKGPKGFDMFVNSFKDKFKDLIGLELKFEEKAVAAKSDGKGIKVEEAKDSGEVKEEGEKNE